MIPDPFTSEVVPPAMPETPGVLARSGHCTTRSAQVALGVFFALTIGLLGFRGYGGGIGARATVSVPPAALDLNRSDPAALEQVPGIGPSLAREIADDRAKRGRFNSVEELRRVKGIGPLTYDKVQAYFQVLPSPDASATPIAPLADPLEPVLLERKPALPSPAPYPRTSVGANKIKPGDAPINVNTANGDELMRLPGIGPVTANNILIARAQKPFISVADLDRAKGIGPKTLEKIRPFVVVK